MKNIKFTLLLVVILSAFGCKENTSSNYDKMAEDLCKCMQPLVDISNKIQKLSIEGDKEELSSMIVLLEKQYEEVEQCTTKLEEEFGPMNTPESEEKANAALKRTCPEVAALINQEKPIE